MSDTVTYDSDFDSDDGSRVSMSPVDPIENLTEMLGESLSSTLRTTVNAMRPPTVSPDCLYKALHAAHRSQIRSVINRSGFLHRQITDWEGTCTSTMDRSCTEIECVVTYKIKVYTKREPNQAIGLDDVKVESRARIVFMSDGRSKRTCDWRVRIPAPRASRK